MLQLTLCCLLTTGLAQHRFDTWTADNGLPQNDIRSIRQSRDGYLLLTTPSGLVRFDGVTFRVFDRARHPGIGSGRMTVLHEDRDGVLWIGTEDAGVITYRDGRFTTHPVPGGWITGISGDQAGGIWASSSGWIFRWDGHRFARTGLPRLVSSTHVRGMISVIGQWAGPGGIWAADDLHLSLLREGALVRLGPADGLPSLDVADVAIEAGVTWAATSAGLARIEGGQITRVYSREDGLPSYSMAFLIGRELKLLCRDGAKLFIMPLPDPDRAAAGASFFPRTEIAAPPAEILEMLPTPTLPKGHNLHEDHEGNLWIGTDGQGLFRMRQQLITTLSRKEGLSQRNIYPVLAARDGAVWAGAWPGSLSRIHGGQIQNFTREDGLSGEEITGLYEDRRGRLWVGAYGQNNGLRLRVGSRFVPGSEVLGVRDLGPVSAFYEDPQGALWLGTESGLWRHRAGAASRYTTADGLAGDNIKVIIGGADGSVWIGSQGGLSRSRGGRFTRWSEAEGLPGSVRALHEDEDGVLWIGTYDTGLGRLHEGRLTRYTTREGLFNNGVFQILEDGRGDLWMSSNQGISRVSKRELNEVAAGQRGAVTAISYGKADGLRNVECNGGRWPAGARTPDGRLWFPTQDGVAVIDPAQVAANPHPPPVVIEGFVLDRAEVPTRGGVRVAPGHDNFEIHYTALSFIGAERLRFRYRLAGLDRDFVDAGTRRVAYYSHVPPGRYTFTVLAANRDGVWNTTGASLEIVVLAPFWRTPWFLLLLLVGLAAGAAGLVRVLLRALRAEQGIHEHFARELIRSQERERQRIAAELHDSLGQILFAIRSRAFLALRRLDEPERTREQLNEISASVADALKEARAIAYNLRPYQLERIGLTRTLQETCAQVERASGVPLCAEMDPIDGLLPKDAELGLFRIVQEGLNNIVQHASASEAWVLLQRRERVIELEIGDNGVGLDTGSARSMRSARSAKGLGLINLRERVHLLGGTCAIHSAPRQGMKIRITLPIPQDAPRRDAS